MMLPAAASAASGRGTAADITAAVADVDATVSSWATLRCATALARAVSDPGSLPLLLLLQMLLLLIAVAADVAVGVAAAAVHVTRFMNFTLLAIDIVVRSRR